MSLIETLKQDMKSAMKAKNNATLSTLRLLLSAIKNKQIDAQGELSDEDVQAVIRSQVKQLKDSIESFRSAGRDEMVESAEAEVSILEAYLPAQMSDEDLEKIVAQVIQTTGAESKADMGRVMGGVMKEVAGRADGGRVKDMVTRLLPVIALVVMGTTAAFDVSAAIPVLDTFSSGTSYAIFLLRITRVLILWIGVGAITMILTGGFDYMNASFRDAAHTAALTKISHGIFASIIIAIVFGLCTIVLQQMV